MNFSKKIRLSLLILVIITSVPVILKAQNRLTSSEIDRLSRSVVQVIAPDGKGSGSIIAGTNRIITNRHVAENFYEFEIGILKDVTRPAVPFFKARLISFSKDYDFAILEITTDMDNRPVSSEELTNGYGDFAGFPRLEHAITDQVLGRGDEIALLGYPGIGDDELVYTQGSISSVKFEDYNEQELPAWYRTSAEMSPGNSGGIAINSRGVVIGIPTYVRTENRTGGRLGNVLAIQMVNEIINENALIASWDDFAGDPNDPDNRVDFTQEPTYGEEELDNAIVNEPFTISVTSGGEINSSYIGSDCSGYVSSAPDYRIQWNGTASQLVVIFKANSESDDATLLINLPNESWKCNDDFSEGNLTPVAIFNNPPAGQYDIWVGSYNQEAYIEGVLQISAHDGGITENNIHELIPEISRLDFNLDPTFGNVTAVNNPTVFEHTVSITSGGEINTSYLENGCAGYAAKAPDFRLQWDKTNSKLVFAFTANETEQDATLLVNLPNGSWLCNDDQAEGSLNPAITIENAEVGQYDVWVGSYNSGEYIEGVLKAGDFILSEATNVNKNSQTVLDYSLEPYFGTLKLESGFTPDPYIMSGQSGGEINIANAGIGDQCIGFASEAPDFRLNWTGTTANLVISFEATTPGDDTILIINTPDGQWLCNDDTTGSNLNPSILLGNTTEGQFDIWVASHQNDKFIDGSLSITER